MIHSRKKYHPTSEVNQMIETIGNAAGEIWRFLDKQTAPVTLSTLRKNLSLSSTLLMMGLGWLAREDKLNIEISNDSYSYRISLKR
ncbi:winged helix-turn-helix domain-containing protein [Candidatus Poribacteria bacterium]|nr:winged helix-turn-helix domain-containing protein [Candidatus Poribacteria bacterium]